MEKGRMPRRKHRSKSFIIFQAPIEDTDTGYKTKNKEDLSSF